MISGRLKHVIRIEKPSVDVSAAGQPTELWDTVAHTRADIYAVSGREWFEAHQVNSSVNTKVVIRFMDGLDASMRVRKGDTIYNIITVLNQENPRKPTILMCERKNA